MLDTKHCQPQKHNQFTMDISYIINWGRKVPVC